MSSPGSSLHLLKMTVFILVVTAFVGWLPFKTEIPKLIRHEVPDYDIYDLNSAGMAGNPVKDKDIIIIGIGDNRKAIAHQLLEIQHLEPAVIGVDAVFQHPSPDTTADRRLTDLDRLTSTIVYAAFLDTNSHHQFPMQGPWFDSVANSGKSGFINFEGNNYSVVRKFNPVLPAADSPLLSFPARIVQKFDRQQYDRLLTRDKHSEYIHYTGNIRSFEHWTAEEFETYFSNGQLNDRVKGKIVLLGYFTESPTVMSDIHFTPVNPVIAGRSFPDMYGVVIHANILRMILDGKYVYEMPAILIYLFTGLLIFGFLWWEEKVSPGKRWMIRLFAESILIFALIFACLLLYDTYRVKTPLFPIVFAFVVKEFHEGLARTLEAWWMALKHSTLMKRNL